MKAVRTGCGNLRGFGLVELLVVLAIAGIILGVVAAFFSMQTRVSSETQARNELNVRVRAVAEALVQDLKLAGSRAVVDDAGRAAFVRIDDPACFNRAECVTVIRTGSDLSVTLFYVSSLFLEGGLTSDLVQPVGVVAPACRRIDYFLDGTSRVLYRRDVLCNETLVPDVQSFAFEFADGIEKINLAFVCSGGTNVTDPALCYDGADVSKFVREGQVSVSGLSDRRSRPDLEMELSTAMPNMRSSLRFQEQ
jgi:prepilin-type N-terminal cleavage/methylation domain-containing protein